jgi:hypothetical protein
MHQCLAYFPVQFVNIEILEHGFVKNTAIFATKLHFQIIFFSLEEVVLFKLSVGFKFKSIVLNFCSPPKT